MKDNSAHQEHGRGRKKGSIWLTTYKKTMIQKGMRKISEIQTLSHFKEAIQLRFITEFPVTFPLTSLVCKNEYHLTVQSLEKDIIILSAEKHNWPSV